MLEIILARHGETEWNVEEVFRGRIDIELNETGRRQAELLAEHLAELKIEAVYSSPLKRALDTAEAIARRHKLKVEANPGLTDCDFGQWQGLPLKEVREKYSELYRQWAESPHRVKIPGGESLDEVRKRALKIVNEILAKHRERVVLVSHRVVNKVLISALLGLDNSHFWKIRQDVGATTTFSHRDGRFVLLKHNDTSYLSPLPKAQRRDF
ncbi:MAG: histidine phosphatase family protein [Dehalococcoidia bacterium]|jgi:broad specificity phosphatase PhoE